MKTFALPTVSPDSLGNSLFDCITIDVTTSQKRADSHKPKIVSAGVICICLRGEGMFVINDTSYRMRRGSLLTILPNTVVSVTYSSDDFLGYAIVADTKFMSTLQIPNVVKSYIQIATNPVVELGDGQVEQIIELGEMLKRRRDIFEESSHFFYKEISRHLLAALCYEIYAIYRGRDSEEGERVAPLSRQGRICQDFMMLVEKYAGECRDMGFYADKLCITPKYLSVVVKKVSGYSPVEWIDRMVMCYARTLLTSSDMTVQQIAAELNFPNPSFFGQYFKRHEGMTPKQFRNKNRS